MSIIRQHVAPKDDRPCMCRICTCGHHECPGMPKMSPLNAVSGYREDYTGKQLDPNDRMRLCRGNNNFQPTRAGPGHFLSTNQAIQAAALNAPRERSSSCRPSTALPQMNRFNGISSYQTDYPGHAASLTKAIRPANAIQHIPAAPGAFETTNGIANNTVLQALRDGTYQRAQTAKGRDGGIIGGAPLNANTTYREEYIKRPIEMPNARKPTDMGLWGRVGDNRDFLTTNGAVYRPPVRDTSAKCPAAHVHVRPASSDGHIKLNDVPDAYGHLTPARDFMASHPRYSRYAVKSEAY